MYKAVQPYMIKSLLRREQIGIVFIRAELWDFRMFEGINNLPIIVFLCDEKSSITSSHAFSFPFTLYKPYQLDDIFQLIANLDTPFIEGGTDFLLVRSKGIYQRLVLSKIEVVERIKLHTVLFVGEEFSLPALLEFTNDQPKESLRNA